MRATIRVSGAALRDADTKEEASGLGHAMTDHGAGSTESDYLDGWFRAAPFG